MDTKIKPSNPSRSSFEFVYPPCQPITPNRVSNGHQNTSKTNQLRTWREWTHHVWFGVTQFANCYWHLFLSSSWKTNGTTKGSMPKQIIGRNLKESCDLIVVVFLLRKHCAFIGGQQSMACALVQDIAGLKGPRLLAVHGLWFVWILKPLKESCTYQLGMPLYNRIQYAVWPILISLNLNPFPTTKK